MSTKLTTSKRRPVPPKIKSSSGITMDTNEAMNPYKYVATDDNSQPVKSSCDTPPNVMKLFRESDGEL